LIVIPDLSMILSAPMLSTLSPNTGLSSKNARACRPPPDVRAGRSESRRDRAGSILGYGYVIDAIYGGHGRNKLFPVLGEHHAIYQRIDCRIAAPRR
jgi:hypothetical protein